MNRADLFNGAAVALAMAVSVVAALLVTRPATSAADDPPIGDGQRFVRIVSASLVSDGILAELADPGTVLVTTRWLEEGHPQGFRFAGLPRVESIARPEVILASKPDLVFVAGSDPAQVARLRESGLRVEDLGGINGLRTLVPAIRRTGELLGHADRAERLVARLQRILAPTAGPDAPRAIYVGAAGDALWGGAADTSYHDVLLAAGLRDAAAEAGFTGWPTLGVEQLLALDPPIVVGEPGTKDTVCHRPGLEALHACTDGRVIELPARVLSDPGPTMADAALALEGAWKGGR